MDEQPFMSNGSEATTNNDGLLWSGEILASELELLSLMGHDSATQNDMNDSPTLPDSGSFALESDQNLAQSQSQLLLDALISARQSAPAAPHRSDSQSDYFDMPSLRGWNPQPQARPQGQGQWMPQPELPPMLAAGFMSQGHIPSSPGYAPQHQGNRQNTFSQHPGPPTRTPGNYNSYSGSHAVHTGGYGSNQGHHNNHRGGGGGGGGPGGGGNRKHWAQVNKVSKGGRLDEGDTSRPLTVEDLIHIVMTMPPGDPAVPVIAPSLSYLDSSAFAAMLKELNKQGLQHRCNEIFDWLRGIPPSHELYRLCGELKQHLTEQLIISDLQSPSLCRCLHLHNNDLSVWLAAVPQKGT